MKSMGKTKIFLLISSSRYPEESEFLKRCKFNLRGKKKWTYASTNGKDFKTDKLVENFVFVLYNQYQYEKNTSLETTFLKFCREINKWVEKSGQEVVVFRHLNDNKCPSTDELKRLFTDCNDCSQFSHPDKIFKPLREFLNSILAE